MGLASGGQLKRGRGDSRARRWVVVAVACCAAFWWAAGCSVARHGTMAQQCTAASECDDGSPCTVNSCSPDGLCVSEAVPDFVLAEQTAGDCLRVECLTGVLESTPDEADLPNDSEECTTDSCSATGVPSNVAVTNGTPCTDGANVGICQDGGCEVGCTNHAQCTSEDSCIEGTCSATGSCVYESLDGDPLPEEQQLEGDCKIVLCSCEDPGGGRLPDCVQGGEIINDGGDEPDDDPDGCSEPICNSGQPEYVNLDPNDPCDVGGDYCDGDGNCVECNSATQCPQPGHNECGTATCSAQGVCGMDVEADGKELSAAEQTDDNCKLLVCDGAGNAHDVLDAADLPYDGNDCTDDVCNGMTPENPILVAGTACGVGLSFFCNDSGQCMACFGADVSNCGTIDDCNDFTCLNGACQDDDPPHGTLTNLQMPNDCRNFICDGTGGTTWEANDSDLPISDGNDCTNDICVAGYAYENWGITHVCDWSGSPGGGDGFCNGSGACVQCNASTQCAEQVCQVETCPTDTCQYVPMGNGTTAQASAQTDYDCQVIECDGSGGTYSDDDGADLPVSDGNDCTDDICAGSPLEPTYDPLPATTPCKQNGGDWCNDYAPDPKCVECALDAHCVSPQTCCNNPGNCGAALWTCTCVPETCGDNGWTCATHIEPKCGTQIQCDNATEDPNETDVDCGGDTTLCPTRCTAGEGCLVDTDCASGLFCDSGTCASEKALGEECGGASECQSTYCVDGRCCDGACGGDCEACNIGGSLGTCSDEANGTSCDDNVYCNGTDTCSGGACTDHTGDPCPGDDGDGDCSESCDEVADDCSGDDPNGSGCDDGLYCNGADTCSSGLCSLHGVDPCPGADGDDDCSESCDEVADDCIADDGDGASCNDGLYCNGADTCLSGLCSVPGVDPCVGPDGDTDCAESCDENGDVCTANDPNGSDCSGGDVCMSGTCSDVRVVFITTTIYDGDDLGSLAAGNAVCAARATAAGLPGTYLAWLSDSSGSPLTNFTLSTVPYMTLDGTTIADDSADLLTGLDAPFVIDELGQGVTPGTCAWTGTQAAGTPHGARCTDWSSTTGTGEYGLIGEVDAAWSEETDFECTNTCHLYCFEQ